MLVDTAPIDIDEVIKAGPIRCSLSLRRILWIFVCLGITAFTVAWSQDSGPAAATLTTTTYQDANAVFSLPGNYTLRLGATGPGPVSTADTRVVTVHDTYATWAAQNKLAELTARGTFPPTGTQSGDIQIGNQTFMWTQTTNDTPNAAFRKVEIAITRPNDARQLARLNAYVVEPSLAQATK